MGNKTGKINFKEEPNTPKLKKKYTKNRRKSSAHGAHQFKYDLIIIGGGSAGIALAKEATKFNKKIAICDFVTPTPSGKTWLIGGTCVNVGCIPKKLMHQSALIRNILLDSKNFGWNVNENTNFNWTELVDSIKDHINILNWNYVLELQNLGIEYINKFAQFVDKNTVELRENDYEEFYEEIDAKIFVIAGGCRPKYLDIPGGRKEDKLCITSDDLFSLPYLPGKILIIGGGYVAVECAGFLCKFGFKITLMVRSKMLKNFDKDFVDLIVQELKRNKVKVIQGYDPEHISLQSSGTPPILKARFKRFKTGKIYNEKFNTILLAIGREPLLEELQLDLAGVDFDENTWRIKVNAEDRTNIPNIYAIGDIAGRPELTPVAVHSARLLANRLYNNEPYERELMDYKNIPTAIYSSTEYAFIGMNEEEATKRYTLCKLNIFHKYFKPLENVYQKEDGVGYAKLICLKSDKNRVIGLHYFGPNAGEVVQGYVLGFRLKATKRDFDKMIGIHPTSAEVFTNLTSLKYTDPPLDKKTSC